MPNSTSSTKPASFHFSSAIFSVSDAADILEVPRRKIALYIEQEIISPSVGSLGKGHQRRLNFFDLLRIFSVHQLADWGIAPRFLRVLSDHLHIPEILSSNDRQPADIETLRSSFPQYMAIAQDDNGDVKVGAYMEKPPSSIPYPFFVVFQYQVILEEVLKRIDRFHKAQ